MIDPLGYFFNSQMRGIWAPSYANVTKMQADIKDIKTLLAYKGSFSYVCAICRQLYMLDVGYTFSLELSIIIYE